MLYKKLEELHDEIQKYLKRLSKYLESNTTHNKQENAKYK